MLSESVSTKIHKLRERCIHECLIIDMLCRSSLEQFEHSPAERASKIKWHKEQKDHAISWYEFEERRLLNEVNGLIPGKNPTPPSTDRNVLLSRRLTNNLSTPLRDDEFTEVFALIWAMCSTSMVAALEGTVPDLTRHRIKLIEELRRFKMRPKGPIW